MLIVLFGEWLYLVSTHMATVHCTGCPHHLLPPLGSATHCHLLLLIGLLGPEENAWEKKKKQNSNSLTPGNLELGLLTYLVILKVMGFEPCKTWRRLAAILCHVAGETENLLLVKGKTIAEVEREDPPTDFTGVL